MRLHAGYASRQAGAMSLPAESVAAAVFGGTVPPDERIARNARQYAVGVPAGAGGVIVGYAAGTAAGAAGLMMADGVARLWGGSVVEAARGRGVYRALLAARLDYGVARGATMALVKARVETSGPILRRAGFLPYGQELTFDVPLG
jgi:GNAT superfamily N-acetyltransferase